MKIGSFRDRAAIAMVLLATASGCQLVKKLTGRGDDAGSSHSTSAPILADGGGPSPVIALPNPTVSPLPTQPTVPTPDTAGTVPPVPAVPDGGPVASADAGAAPTQPGIAVVDAGAIPAMDPRLRRSFTNYCKEHPGQIHPRTHLPCPI